MAKITKGKINQYQNKQKAKATNYASQNQT